MPKMFAANSTATLATLTWPSVMPVWLRASFADWNAFWKIRFSTAPVAPRACAAA